ncbi:EDD domain protein, DegV family [Lachnospiraceae bacterium C10]|jgi:DegV family protein with EDD domain|nr:EDD domain protein, DegV family [Lachnospiraceae bacterium C10]SDW64752.1 EDD domain protein, DegV family [Lachnospiraceae bacterium KHCPX20]
MYKIIIDSCGEIPQKLKGDGRFVNVPLTLSIDDWEKRDDEAFDQEEFLARMKASKNIPHSACPSPADYLAEIEEGDAEHVYIVTLSAKLSGSYNAACLAKSLYEEDHEDDEEDEIKKIHVFDSKSASIGQTLIGMKAAECEDAGLSFEEVVEATDRFIAGEHTFFCLESLETLRKAGRLGSLKAMLANTLNIKPVMGSTDEGSIQQLGQARGMAKALDKMVECMMAVTENPTEKIVAISHCAAPATANMLVERVKKAAKFKDVFTIDTQGISSLYAGPGGVIMVV